jgi:hypothetical protein
VSSANDSAKYLRSASVAAARAFAFFRRQAEYATSKPESSISDDTNIAGLKSGIKRSYEAIPSKSKRTALSVFAEYSANDCINFQRNREFYGHVHDGEIRELKFYFQHSTTVVHFFA